MSYHHTQIALITIAAFLVVGVSCIVGILLIRARVAKWTLGIVTALLVALAVIFSSLTVDVRDDQLAWYFGPGFWSYSLAREHIQSVAVVRNPWQYGFGIRVGPGFRLYNVQGLDAVELRLKDGEVRRIGTDDPHGLAAALKR